MPVDRHLRIWLEDLLKGSVLFDEPMWRHTTFKVGGPADVLAMPENEAVLSELVSGLSKREKNCLVVGGGSNLLVKDSGIRKVVIVLKGALKEISVLDKEGTVSAMAGASTHRLCRFALDRCLSGMNFALGIPGTVGGAIVMNAGTRHGAMESVLKSIRVLGADGVIEEICRDRLKFSYRRLDMDSPASAADSKMPVVLEGRFALAEQDPEKLKREARDIVRWRKNSQPTNLPSAGCFFKNPPGEESAGRLIDMAGLKGTERGGAVISTRHANFIVNRKNASASDILFLKDLIEKRVFEEFGIRLEPEVEIVGD